MPHKEYIREVENADNAYLFIHGIIGSPDHFKKLTELVPNDSSVYNILLDGHGKNIKDFAKSSMKKWEDQVENMMIYLNRKYKNIVIIGHSMGTLLAIETALKYPQKIKRLFLLSFPVKVAVKPMAVSDEAKVFFDKIGTNDITANAAKNGHSIKQEKHLLKYFSFIPRYIELFLKINETDKQLSRLIVPAIAFQSEKDEYVSPKSYDMLKEYPIFETILLKNSYHNYYSEEDFLIIKEKFKEIIL